MSVRTFFESLARPLRGREAGRWAAVDDSSGPYARTFRIHRLAGDPAWDACWLWRDGSYIRPGGLHGDLRERARRSVEPPELDILLVMHPDDLADSEERGGGGWREETERWLAEQADDLAARFDWALRPAGYRFDVCILPDAHPDLRCTLGLARGSFATAVGVRTVRRRAAASPELRVFVRPPGGSPTAVGTIWTDQARWNAGGHALDDVRVAGLPPAALRAERDQGGGDPGPGSSRFTFRLAGPLARTHRLIDRSLRGSRLLAVRSVDGETELVRLELRSAAGEAAKVVPSYAPVPAIRTISPARPVRLEVARAFASSPGPVVLREVGTMVQRIHFPEIKSFWLGVERDGRLDPEPLDPVARLEVFDDCLRIVGISEELVVDDELLAPGKRRKLAGAAHELSWEGGAVRVVPTRLRGEMAWPYLARVEIVGRHLPLRRGDSYRIGRSSEAADIELPERRTAKNITWADGLDDGPVELGGTSVERTSVTTDAIGVPGRGAELTLDELEARLTSLSESCPAWVLRADGGFVPLGEGASQVLLPGDRFIVGNTVFEADLPDRQVTSAPSPDDIRTVIVGLGSAAFRRGRSVAGRGFQPKEVRSLPRGLKVGSLPRGLKVSRPPKAEWRRRPPNVGNLPRMMPKGPTSTDGE